MSTISHGTVLDRVATPKGRVMHNLRTWIERGDLSRGDPLPSERALAMKLDVARGTVRVAIEELVRQGIISEGNGRRRVASRPASPKDTPAPRSSLMAHSIGVIMSREGRVSDRLDVPGFEMFVELGAFDAVADAGMHGIKLYPDRLAGESIRQLIDDRPMGVVFGRFPGDRAAGERMASALHEAEVPVVVYGDTEFNDAYDRVYSDHEQGTYELTRWLIQRGRSRILRLWPVNRQNHRWLQARDRGYLRACGEAGVQPLEPAAMAPVAHSLGEKDRFDHNTRLVAGHLVERFAGRDPQATPDALMLISDGDVYPVAAACRLFGLQPGRDLDIVGYDNYWPNLIDRRFDPVVPAATVDKLNLTLGQELVKLLIDRVQGKLPEGPQKRVVQPRLVVPDARP